VSSRVLFVSRCTSPPEGELAAPASATSGTLACLSRTQAAEAEVRQRHPKELSRTQPPARSLSICAAGVSAAITSLELSAAEAPPRGN
jgi:hypothetical protein